MNGGRGGAVKNRGAKRPLYCAAQLNFVSSRHGEIYLPCQKVWSAKHPLTCAAQLNFVSSRHGEIYLPYGSDNPDRKTLPSLPGLLIINQPSGLFAERGVFVLPECGRLFFGSFIFCTLILSGSVIYYCL